MTAHLVNISGGMASAVSLIRVLERFGPQNVHACFADVEQEHPDCYRFINDVQRVSGVSITRLSQGMDCWDVWMDRLMLTMPGNRSCLASYHLKKVPLRKHAEENFTPDETTIYVGYGKDEPDRAERLTESGKPWQFDFPLWWKPALGRCDLADILREKGIEPPSMYAEGYPHANCKGACILAGVAQWAGLYRDDPQTYRHNEEKEQVFLAKLRAAGRKEITILRDRRGGTTKNLSLKQLREEIESGERWPNDDWRSASCSCMGNLFT